MDKSFHYLIMINQALFHKKAIARLMEEELTSGQPKILDYLLLHDGSIQRDIAFACQIDPATVTGLLSRMEDRGYIERKIKDGNRRSSYVYLTDSGKAKAQVISSLFAELEDEVFQGISSEEKESFMNTFYKICTNMTDTRGLQ